MEIMSIILCIWSLFVTVFYCLINKPILGIIWGLIFICWIAILFFEHKNKNKKRRGFEVVETKFRKTKDDIKLPTRGTEKAMAYDFYSNDNYYVRPNEIVKIWTDVKSYMQDDECLILNVRSSMGGKFMLANTQGWIDADYYSNENNDGNIGIFLKNISNEHITINKGDRIAQGAFFSFLIADNGNTDKKRKGGFGSTNV